ncbi:unnamed protein product [Prorocentrum cordatum]|uniref:Uncharacterized protein n=1 Tax=Prorocentrum cordatum TaxID=2364126 RepID=A0ABN9TA14_9DINO|nr:unnamed protein product [Polarella glacialis]
MASSGAPAALVPGLPPLGVAPRARGGRAHSARSRMDRSVRDTPLKEKISGCNPLYAGGTHRSPQCSSASRTPGPGAYRTSSLFQSDRDQVSLQRVRRRPPAWRLNSRSKRPPQVDGIKDAYKIVSPFMTHFMGAQGGTFTCGADRPPASAGAGGSPPASSRSAC